MVPVFETVVVHSEVVDFKFNKSITPDNTIMAHVLETNNIFNEYRKVQLSQLVFTGINLQELQQLDYVQVEFSLIVSKKQPNRRYVTIGELLNKKDPVRTFENQIGLRTNTAIEFLPRAEDDSLSQRLMCCIHFGNAHPEVVNKIKSVVLRTIVST